MILVYKLQLKPVMLGLGPGLKAEIFYLEAEVLGLGLGLVDRGLDLGLGLAVQGHGFGLDPALCGLVNITVGDRGTWV